MDLDKKESVPNKEEEYLNEFLGYFWNPKEEDIEYVVQQVSLKDLCLFMKTLKVTKEEVQAIANYEQRTPEWFRAREGRLTASNFGAANGTNKYLKPKKLLVQLLWPDTFRGNPATRYGTLHEEDACDAYETFKMLQLESMGRNPEDLQIEHIGLYVCERYPWLGASPDLIIHFNDSLQSNAKTTWLGEIKCPYPGKSGEAKPYEQIPQYYYDQIQGIMAIMNLPFCDFIVWTEKETHISRFVFDRVYFKERLFPNLQSFYIREFLPRIIFRNNNLLNYGEIDYHVEDVLEIQCANLSSPEH